ncbi:unnamed protein product, partial [Polarella glacialis]
ALMWPLGGSPMASPQTHSPWRGQVSHGSVWTAAPPPAPPQVLRGATAVWQPLAPQASLARPLVAEQSTPAAPSSAGFQPMAMAAPAYASATLSIMLSYVAVVVVVVAVLVVVVVVLCVIP